MRILLVGVGGVGGAVTKIAARREFVERLVVADYDAARAEKAVAAMGDPRFVATQVDATDEAAVRALLTEHRCDALLNATDPQFVERVVVAGYDAARAETAVAAMGDPRFVASQVDATGEAAVRALLTEHRCDALLNATDPRFVMPLFRAALAAGVHYLDMAMSLSKPHPERPYEETGVKLGDEQFALADEWTAAGKLALVGIGIEPGLADVFARYAA